MTTKTSATMGFLYTGIAVTIILLYIGDAFIKGGITAADTFRKWLIWSGPIATVATSAIIVRKYARDVIQRRKYWYKGAVFVASFFLFFIMFMYEQISGAKAFWFPLYSLLYLAGMGGYKSMVTFAFLKIFIRQLTATTLEKTIITVVFFFAMLGATGVGGAIHPILAAPQQFVTMYLSGAAVAGLWTTWYIGTAAIVIRVLVGREKLVSR